MVREVTIKINLYAQKRIPSIAIVVVVSGIQPEKAQLPKPGIGPPR